MLRGHYPGKEETDSHSGQAADDPGRDSVQQDSRFVREIPRELIDLGRDGTTEHAFKKPELFGGAEVPRKKYTAETFKPRQFTVTKADSLDYGVGDTVRHVKFGVGVVQSIAEGGRDYEVTVDFDRFGVKRCSLLSQIEKDRMILACLKYLGWWKH